MRKMILASIIHFFAICANSQKLFSVSAYAGPSFSMGSFSSAQNYIGPNAYAKPGFTVNAEADYLLFKHFGILAQYRFQHHAVNTGAMDYIYAAYNYATVTSDPWKMHSILLGLYYPLQLGNGFCLDLALKTGSLKTAQPKKTVRSINYFEYDTVYNYEVTNEVRIKWSLAFSAAGKLRYQYSKKLQLLANLDYFYSNPSINSELVTVYSYQAFPWGRTPESSSAITYTTHKQKIFALNFALGVQVNLGHD